jgi:hypothetical protein
MVLLPFFSRPARGALMLAVLLTAAPFSEAMGKQAYRVDNVRFEVQGGQVIVLYDLTGRAGQENHEVTLVLRKEGDDAFQYTPAPENVSGDVGVGWFMGYNRRMVWTIEKEFPKGLPDGDKYYFVVQVKPLKQNGNRRLWTFGIGSMLVGGGALAIWLWPDAPSRLPMPPGRP